TIADQERMACELVEARDARTGMGDQHLRILLEDRGNGDERRLLTHVGDGLVAVRHDHVDAAGQQELADVEAGTARPQIAVDAVFAVDAGRYRLVVAAVLGLGTPVGVETETVKRLRARTACERHQHRRRNAKPQHRAPAEPPGARHLASAAMRQSKLSATISLIAVNELVRASADGNQFSQNGRVSSNPRKSVGKAETESFSRAAISNARGIW